MPTQIRTSLFSVGTYGGAITLLALLFVQFTVGCSRGTQLRSQAAGHAITAEIAGSHAIEADAERATVSGPYGKVTIERTRARVEGLDWTQIPADVPVEIKILRGRLSVNAGGVSIRRTISSQ